MTILLGLFPTAGAFWIVVLAWYYYAIVFRPLNQAGSVQGSLKQKQSISTALVVVLLSASVGLPLTIALVQFFTGWLANDASDFESGTWTRDIATTIGPSGARWYRWFWSSPIILALLICFIIYTLLMVISPQAELQISLCRAGGCSQLCKKTRILSLPIHFRISLYLLVFLIAWGPWLSLIVVATITPCLPTFLIILSNVMQSLIGFLDALVYGLTTRQTREYMHYLGLWKGIAFTAAAPLLIFVFTAQALVRRIRGNSGNPDKEPLMPPVGDRDYAVLNRTFN